MMRIITAAIISLVSFIGVSARAQSTCHAADRRSDHFISVVNRMMGADRGPTRASIGLPLVDTSQVTLVSDPAICARAGQALDSLNHALRPEVAIPPPDTLPLYVLRVGSFYAVADLNYPSSNHYDFLFFFGALWQFLSMRLV
jgi:hypothetical protein